MAPRRSLRNQTINIRVTSAELEMVRAAADAMGWTVTDMLLSGALALGVDIKTRWDGPWPPEVTRARHAYQAVEREHRERLGPLLRAEASLPSVAAFLAATKDVSLEAEADARGGAEKPES